MVKKTFILCPIILFILWIAIPIGSTPTDKNKIKYEKYESDAVMKEIREKREAQAKTSNEKTGAILNKYKQQKEERKILKSDLNDVFAPSSLESFKTEFHFPPQPQYATLTCWSFAATSFYESEIFRLTGKKIKLSEMWTPYFEYIEKAMRFITERGNSVVSGGAQFDSLKRIWEKYGLAPAEVYSGLLPGQDKHDHTLLVDELNSYLDYIKTHNLWQEEENRRHIELIVDKHMGRPKQTFNYEEKDITAQEFLSLTGINLDDYFSLMSTSAVPFYSFQEFKYPDNWWHSNEYINIPLDEWYRVIKNSIKSGYTVAIGGDTSEPGYIGKNDIAFIPSFDIPENYINQDSREYRIYNGTTDDDHGIHLVGYSLVKGKDWFLLKDSNRSSRLGKFPGYYFFRGDFVKLKMLSFMVHRDMIKEILKKVKK